MRGVQSVGRGQTLCLDLGWMISDAIVAIVVPLSDRIGSGFRTSAVYSGPSTVDRSAAPMVVEFS